MPPKPGDVLLPNFNLYSGYDIYGQDVERTRLIGEPNVLPAGKSPIAICEESGMSITTLIHLSDIHIGRGKIELERAKQIFQKISEIYPGCPVLITGDITDSATRGQFKLTRSLLDGLAESNPILVVPGNHDYAWKGTIHRKNSWKNWVRYLGTPLGWGTEETHWMEPSNEPEGVDGLGIWRHGKIAFFGVDSGDPDDHEHTARGWISPELAAGLNKSLADNNDYTRVVLVHHHPFMHGTFMKMAGAERFLAALRNNCEVLLFGHKHQYGIWWRREQIPLVIASHKSTNVKGLDMTTGDRPAITAILVENAGTPQVSFSHRLEVF